MLDVERMRQWQAAQEKAAREWQADESRLNREHQKRLTDASDAIQSDMAKATARAARFQFWGLAIAAFGIVVAAIVSQI